jgi:hypothetical protein
MGQAKKKQYGQSREELMMMCIGDVIQVAVLHFLGKFFVPVNSCDLLRLGHDPHTACYDIKVPNS